MPLLSLSVPPLDHDGGDLVARDRRDGQLEVAVVEQHQRAR
jgi:hypothetical protein